MVVKINMAEKKLEKMAKKEKLTCACGAFPHHNVGDDRATLRCEEERLVSLHPSYSLWHAPPLPPPVGGEGIRED